VSIQDEVHDALHVLGEFGVDGLRLLGRRSSVGEIEEFERSHDVSLPDDYRWFLQTVGGCTTNGARVVADCATHPGTFTRHALSTSRIYPMARDEAREHHVAGEWGALIDFWGSVVEDQQVDWSWSLMPFAGHDADGWFCFDFRFHAERPPVIHVDPGSIAVVARSGVSEAWPQAFQFVAESFLDFLGKIVPDEQVEVSLKSPEPIVVEGRLLEWSQQRDAWLGADR